MDPKDIKAAIHADVQKQEKELLAKKLLLKQLDRKPRKHFIETKVGRGWNHTVVFLTEPMARANHNAKRKLEHPKEWLCEQLLKEADRLLKQAEAITVYPNYRSNKVAIRAAKLGVRLIEYAELKEFKDVVDRTRKELAKVVSKYRMVPVVVDTTEIEEFLAGGIMPSTSKS